MKFEKNTDREASLNVVKFFRLLRVRLVTQGFKASAYWLLNVFNRLILDRPIRSQCQITPTLFVGAQFRERGWQIVQGWGISGVVNLRSEFDDRSLKINLPAYIQLATRDDDAPSLADLQRGVDFIHAEIDRGGKVYIHCGAGVGRAPSMAAAYLVSTGLSVKQAWDTIQTRRIFIRPTPAQRSQLEAFAKAIQKTQTPA